jgi:ribosomal protein S18 acetylase RimI-like enzyme
MGLRAAFSAIAFPSAFPDNNVHMITVTRLAESRWADYRDIRLEALKNNPTVFGSAYEEELPLPEAEWRRRMQNALFAVEAETPAGTPEGKALGMIVCARNNRIKTSHICNIYSVYLNEDYRGRGIGDKLMEAALAEIKKMPGVVKIELAVNPTQKAAAHLYRKYGFKLTGRVKKALRVNGNFYDELMMEKHL